MGISNTIVKSIFAQDETSKLEGMRISLQGFTHHAHFSRSNPVRKWQ
jgi:hypothetical protein